MIQTSVSGWLQRLVPVVAAAMAGALPGQAFAPHPLRPGAAASVAMPAAADRPKSLRQQESRELTRRCGAEWRALKAKGQTGGKAWAGFHRDCRDRLKASGR